MTADVAGAVVAMGTIEDGILTLVICIWCRGLILGFLALIVIEAAVTIGMTVAIRMTVVATIAIATMVVAGTVVSVCTIEDGILTLIICFRLTLALVVIEVGMRSAVAIGMAIVAGAVVAVSAIEDGILFSLIWLGFFTQINTVALLAALSVALTLALVVIEVGMGAVGVATAQVAGTPVAVGTVEDGILTLVIGIWLTLILSSLGLVVIEVGRGMIATVVAVAATMVAGTPVAVSTVEDGVLTLIIGIRLTLALVVM